MGRKQQHRPAIDNGIEQCEQRLALSASLMADLLLDAIGSAEPEADANGARENSDILTQAAEVRGTHGLTGDGQTVAVIDSGIAWDHLALGGGFGPGYRVVGGWDFAEDDATPYDDGPAGYHGSHVSGLLAGNSKDLVGMAPGADLVGLRVFDDSGAGKLQWIESALAWVHDHRDSFEHPITTVNLSVGTALTAENQADAESMLGDELQQLREDGILVFAAAGNLFGDSTANNEVLFPASHPAVVAVTSLNDEGRLSDFAQRESGILAARGQDISSTVPEHVFGWDGDNDDLASLHGTSLATPQVAGASMLIREALAQQGIEPTADEVLQRLHDTSQQRIDPVTGESFQTVDLTSAVAGEQASISRFEGSHDADQITLDLRDGIELRMNGLSYSLLPGSPTQPLVIDVGGGADSLEIIGSEQAERLVMNPNDASSRLTTNEYEIQLRGFEQVDFLGGGGPDRATLYDSRGDDELVSHPHHAKLSGVGFAYNVSGIPRVYVHATAGGVDTAYLHDSQQDDALSVRPQFTSLRNDQTFQLAYGFQRVYAYAGAGGNDAAEIFDSAGDDTMSVSENRSMISSDGYYVSARGFASVIGHATAGGHDVAQIYAAAASRWHVTADMVQWGSEHDALRVARGFERFSAFENFEPIDLALQRIGQPPTWAELESNREADAARAVFDTLGQSL